eukprot:3786666-Rhodomonas_salina.1
MATSSMKTMLSWSGGPALEKDSTASVTLGIESNEGHLKEDEDSIMGQFRRCEVPFETGKTSSRHCYLHAQLCCWIITSCPKCQVVQLSFSKMHGLADRDEPSPAGGIPVEDGPLKIKDVSMGICLKVSVHKNVCDITLPDADLQGDLVFGGFGRSAEAQFVRGEGH